MVLSEPAGSISGGHEKGCPLMIEIRILDQLDHIPGRHDAGITLFSGGELPSPIEGFFIRFRDDL